METTINLDSVKGFLLTPETVERVIKNYIDSMIKCLSRYD